MTVVKCLLPQTPQTPGGFLPGGDLPVGLARADDI